MERLTERVSDHGSRSYTQPKNARTFRALHKWDGFSESVNEFCSTLDDTQAIYNPLVRHAVVWHCYASGWLMGIQNQMWKILMARTLPICFTLLIAPDEKGLLQSIKQDVVCVVHFMHAHNFVDLLKRVRQPMVTG